METERLLNYCQQQVRVGCWQMDNANNLDKLNIIYDRKRNFMAGVYTSALFLMEPIEFGNAFEKRWQALTDELCNCKFDNICRLEEFK